MSFNSSGYTLQFAGNIFDNVFERRQHVYTTSDNLADITSHYFDSLAPNVRSGDYFLVTANDGKGFFVAVAAGASTVTTTQVF